MQIYAMQSSVRVRITPLSVRPLCLYQLLELTKALMCSYLVSSHVFTPKLCCEFHICVALHQQRDHLLACAATS